MTTRDGRFGLKNISDAPQNITLKTTLTEVKVSQLAKTFLKTPSLQKVIWEVDD